MPRVALNGFVKRQTQKSQFSHFDGSWEDLLTLTETQLDLQKVEADEEGIAYVLLPTAGFWSGVVPIHEGDSLRTTYAKRPGALVVEKPYKQTVVLNREKEKANWVCAVLYTHSTLEKDASTDAEFEIVTILASTKIFAYGEMEPTHPYTMARNQEGLSGGTKKKYRPEEWARSELYWDAHANVEAKSG